MELEGSVSAPLWHAVVGTYEAGNYRHAIVDAIRYLFDLLRAKSGLDTDGVQLVGQALGGESPRLKLNKLETQTEKDIQKGLEQILRGLYQSVRNPRAHEQMVDSKGTADSIIMFVNFLAGTIDEAQEPFTVDTFLARVFDRDFVKTDHYAALMALEIPANKRTDTLIEIYRRRSQGDEKITELLSRAVTGNMTEDEIARYLDVVSRDLKTVEEEEEYRSSLRMIPPNYWPTIAEVARVRVENHLLQSIAEGYVSSNGLARAGALGTWARDFLLYFTLKVEAAQELLRKLESDNDLERLYVGSYFFSIFPALLSDKRHQQWFVRVVANDILYGRAVLRKELVSYITEFPLTIQTELARQLKSKTNPDSPATRLSDGTPFLEAEHMSDEDIPF